VQVYQTINMTVRRSPLELCKDRDPLFPVQAFFNSISDMSFISTMSHISESHGFSTDYCHCRFPSDFDPWDNQKPFAGVQFSLFNDTVVISRSDFLIYCAMVCERHLDVNPDNKSAVEDILAKLRNNS
jgi:hypothetical protein